MSEIPAKERKLVAGLLGIMLGTFGAHKFYLGYTSEGVILLSISLGSFVVVMLSCGILFPLIIGMVAAQIIGIVEGVIYLSKPDDEFQATYRTNKKPWF